MTNTKSLKINFVMNTILTMSSFIFPLITFPYISRILLPLGTGKVSFAASIISYFAMFAQLGIPTYGIRACAKVRDNKEKLSKTVQEIFIINSITSACVYIAFLLALFNIPRLNEDKPLFLVTSVIILFNVIGMEWLYKALEQYTYITVRSIIFKFIAVIAMFILIHKQWDYIIYGGISVFAASASSVLNFINVHKYIYLYPVKNYNLKRHLKPVLIFFAMSCATTVYNNLDTVMLGFMKTDIDVGYYNAAIKIKTVLISFVTSLGVVLLPRASYYIEQGMNESFLTITKKAINFVFIIASPLMVYFIIFSQECVVFLFGSAYENSILPMQIIMLTLLIIGLSNIMGIQMLVPLGKEKIVLYSEIAGAIVDLFLNMILIPKMAAVGAAIGTLSAECIVWVVQFFYLRKVIYKTYMTVHYSALCLAIFLSIISSLWIKIFNFNMPIVIFTSGILFFSTYTIVLLLIHEPLVVEIKTSVINKLKEYRVIK